LGAVLGRPTGRADELRARSVIESWSIYPPLYLRDSQVNCGVCSNLCFASRYSKSDPFDLTRHSRS
jgi:Pyruvate/2-oxoacid:ferredoxin oxidoreductase delta subunit